MHEFIVKDSRKREYIIHPATKVAIAALEQVREEQGEYTQMLDIGCGSGLLSLVMAELWPNANIVASDISKLAIEEASENAISNGVEDRVHCVVAEGLDHPDIQAREPYDLVIANILAKWHVQYLRDMQVALKPEGRLILSGIQPWQLQELEQAISFAKLSILSQMESEGWVGLVLG